MKKSLCFLILLISFFGHSEKAFSQYSDVFPLRWNTLFPYNYRHSFGTVFPFRLYYTSIEIISGGQHAYLSSVDCSIGNITNRCSFYVNFCFEEQGVYHTVVRFSGNEVSNAGNGDFIGQAYTYDRDFTVDVQEGGSNPGHCAGFIPAPTPGNGGGGGSPPSPTPTPTPPTSFIKITSLSGKQEPLSVTSPIPIINGSNISLVLGGLTKIQLVESDGTVRQAEYRLSGAPAFDPSASNVDSLNGLYPDRLALLFSEGTSTDGQEIMPVHLGNQTIIIKPLDSQNPAITLNLKIKSPGNLGSKNHEYDELIVDFAHVRGVPPQVIKGQIAHESADKFKTDSFRYEPRIWDKAQQSTKLWDLKPYKDYKLSNVLNPLLVEMLFPRRIYKARINGASTSIPDNYETTVRRGYTPLTAQELMISNNEVQNWEKKISKVGELDGDGVLFNFIVNSNLLYDDYDFTAQTILASSYGLLQIMYPTAIDNCGFKVSNGPSKKPTDLFIPRVNIDCGTFYLTKVYFKTNENEGKADKFILNNSEDFESAIRNALQKYNGSIRKAELPNEPSYNLKVWLEVLKYWPDSLQETN